MASGRARSADSNGRSRGWAIFEVDTAPAGRREVITSTGLAAATIGSLGGGGGNSLSRLGRGRSVGGWQARTQPTCAPNLPGHENRLPHRPVIAGEWAAFCSPALGLGLLFGSLELIRRTSRLELGRSNTGVGLARRFVAHGAPIAWNQLSVLHRLQLNGKPPTAGPE